MTNRIDAITWLLLPLAALAVKFFLLPDTALMTALTIIFTGVCGAGALFALNKPRAGDDTAEG